MTASSLDWNGIKEEITVYLRNSDIYTITQRSVTTATATGTFASTSSLLINRTNVKNIRSITVVTTELTFGTDYTVDYWYNDSGTRKCKITFVAAQTGAYSIPYDYGSDLIFEGRPRVDLTLSSFPRLAVEVLGDDTSDADIGGDTEESNISFAITVFDDDSDDIDSALKSVRTKMLEYKKSFYYLKYVHRLNTGPLLPFVLSKGKVDQKAINYMSNFNFETTTGG